MRNLLLSSVTLLLVPAVSVAAPDFPSHTHTYTPIELEPISDIPASLKLASVCFLGAGDCGDAGFNTVGGEDYTRPTSELCIEAGYATTSCALPNYLYDRCPDNDAYYRSCREDKARACKEAGFTETSCPSGYITDRTCPYDSSYITCKENPCSGYSTCECGAAAGASICYSGSTAKYSACENCDPCPGYYECGGSWQYCEGSVCSADSSRCSTYCSSDYFPYSCPSENACSSVGGIYRSGYCSKSCPSAPINRRLGFWCCLPGSCDYETCYSIVGYNCNNHPGKAECVAAGASIRFVGCVGPDFGPFGNGVDAGKTPSHNGAEYACDY